MKSTYYALTAVIIGGVLWYGLGTVRAQNVSPFVSQMGPGSSGSEVTKLQTFLASNPRVYPQALVTGYYGPLTEAAVRNFQIGYALPAVGRFGPATQTTANSLIATGKSIDVSAPDVSSTVTTLGTSATVSWNTSEQSMGTIYYATTVLPVTEASQSKQAPYVGGTAVADATWATSRSLTISNLLPNTQYHYRIVVTDLQGNVSVTNEQVFTTGN